MEEVASSTLDFFKYGQEDELGISGTLRQDKVLEQGLGCMPGKVAVGQRNEEVRAPGQRFQTARKLPNDAEQCGVCSGVRRARHHGRRHGASTASTSAWASSALNDESLSL